MAEVTRERWTSRAPFIFAAIGSAIGLGNVWRFPYITYEYGGGTFLIPYVIGLIVIGIPWMIMEFGMGRFFQKGAPGAFEGIGKKWEWLGWWPVWVAFMIVTYYTVVIAWSLRFAISSINVAWGMGQAGAEGAGDFFFGTVLQLSDGPTVLGPPVWFIFGLLAFVWLVIFLIMFRGARVIGKVSVALVILPWLLLVVLFIRGVTLPGALDGLNYYLTPDFAVLGDVEVWFAAFSQIAFTLSLGMAGMIAYGSFIAKKADVNNSAVIASFSDAATAFFAGFAIFSTVGFIMQAMNIPIGDVSAAGLGLAFVTYPVAVSMMPGANALVGVLFFLCLFFLGTTSAYFLAYGGVAVPLMDKFGWSRIKATLVVTIVAFLVGILFTTQGGLYWLDMVDRAAAFYGLLITGALACLVIGWAFGPGKLREHTNETSDIRIGAWWDWFIRLIVPAGLIFVMVVGGFMKDGAEQYGGYEIGALGGSDIIWILLGVTLLFSILLSLIKTKTAGGGE
ncbi:MAG: sodium-dependent transporter [Dehalococcoidales bacterium]|nr:sodium-dependent transporter [Dehalococcoidales bacterium]